MSNKKWIGYQKKSENCCARMIAFSYAGSNALVYKKWFDKIEDDSMDFISIELPGKGCRSNEKSYTSMEMLLNDLFPVIEELYCDNLILLGYSMGAILAYELAIRLQNRKLFLKALVIIARIPPHLSEHEEKRGHMNEEQLKNAIIELGGTPEAIIQAKEFFDYYLEVFRKDFILIDSYRPKQTIKLVSPLIIYGGIKDKEALFLDLYEWKKYAQGRFIYRLFKGDHFFANEDLENIISTLLTDISTC